MILQNHTKASPSEDLEECVIFNMSRADNKIDEKEVVTFDGACAVMGIYSNTVDWKIERRNF